MKTEIIPPIIAQEEETNEQLMQSIREAIVRWIDAGASFLEREAELARPLARLKKRLDHGRWLEALQELKLRPRTVQLWLRNLAKRKNSDFKCASVAHLEETLTSGLEEVSEEISAPEAPKLQNVCHAHWKLGHKEPVKGCQDCKRIVTGHQDFEFEEQVPVDHPQNQWTIPATPEPRTAQPGKKRERKDGEDAPEPLDRAQRIIEKEIEEASLAHQVSKDRVAGLKAKIKELLDAVRKLFHAPKKTPFEPKKKKCQCGADILLAPTAKGKIVGFVEGKGKFDLIDGVMQHVGSGGVFRPHFLTCPSRSKK